MKEKRQKYGINDKKGPRSNEKKDSYSPYVREEASSWKIGQLG